MEIGDKLTLSAISIDTWLLRVLKVDIVVTNKMVFKHF